MRSDYLLYALAVVFFVITIISLVLVIDQTEKSLWVVTTVVLGFFSAGLGYYYRPKEKIAATPTPEVPTSQSSVEKHEEPQTTPISEAPIPAVTPAVEAPAPITSELTAIRGISEKRAAQLKELGINSIDTLANASAEDLAKNLAVSPRITRMWIGSAKKIKK